MRKNEKRIEINGLDMMNMSIRIEKEDRDKTKKEIFIIVVTIIFVLFFVLLMNLVSPQSFFQ